MDATPPSAAAGSDGAVKSAGGPPRQEPETGVSTGAVARRLGVSPTTLRSWERRYGVGPAVREGRRHRRWTARDIALLEEMCRLTASGIPPAEAARAVRAGTTAASGGAAVVPRPREGDAKSPERAATGAAPGAARSPGGSEPLTEDRARLECRGLSRAAVRLDAVAVEERLAALVRRYGLVTAWDEVVVPTLRAVGRRWESAGDRYVEVEHLLSWHVSAVLHRVPVAPRLAAPPALLACVPGEQHTLPLEALAAGLRARGLPVRMFGGAVPAEALDAAVRRTGPTAVVLWAQCRSTASRPLARHVAANRWGVRGARTRCAVMLAGPGWSGTLLPGTLRPPGLREALDSLSGILSTTAESAPAPGRRAPAPG